MAMNHLNLTVPPIRPAASVHTAKFPDSPLAKPTAACSTVPSHPSKWLPKQRKRLRFVHTV